MSEVEVSRNDVELTGAAVLDIAAYRNGDMDFIFDLEDFDGASDTFRLEIFDRRGGASELTMTPTFTVETQTFQEWIDEGYFTIHELPVDMTVSDNFTITTFTIAITASDLQTLSSTTEQFGKSVLHYEMYYSSNGVRIVDGDFIILE